MIRYKCDRSLSPENGDCMRCCIATILTIDPANIPNFAEGDRTKDFRIPVNEYLKQFHLAINAVAVEPDTDTKVEDIISVMSSNKGVPMILIGGTEKGINHAVVVLDNEIYNNPSEAEIVGPASDGVYWVCTIAVCGGRWAK